jgi:hypothetical protein
LVVMVSQPSPRSLKITMAHIETLTESICKCI